MSCSTDTKPEEAVEHAKAASDQYGLPQTVYSNADSGGWWHTHPYAKLLHGSKMLVTILPENFFR